MGIKQLVIAASFLAAATGLQAADAPQPAQATPPVQGAAVPPAPQAAAVPLEWRLTADGGRIRTLVKAPGASDAGFDVLRTTDATLVRYRDAGGDTTHEDSFSLLPREAREPARPKDAVGPPLAVAERTATGWSIAYLSQENRVRVAYAQQLPEGVPPPQAPAADPDVVAPLIASHSIVQGAATVTFLPWASRPGDYFAVRSMPGSVSVVHADGQGGMTQQDAVDATPLAEAALNKVKAMVEKSEAAPAAPLFAVAQRGFNGWNIAYVGADGQAAAVFAVDAPKPVAPPVMEGHGRYGIAAGLALALALVAGGITGWLLYRRGRKPRSRVWEGPARA